MGQKKRILVIDDEVNICELLSLEFTDLGYEVSTANSAFNGLLSLKKQAVDLVILDIKMPGMDGIEALEKIISTQNNLPVIIHSAYSHFKENYLTWSATSYVIKSGNLTELKQTVQDILNP
ncbi:MAG: response regulator [Deltaproteobacteria bacterium]|nr:response regulator [Deltaproteobacteria bacterium]